MPTLKRQIPIQSACGLPVASPCHVSGYQSANNVDNQTAIAGKPRETLTEPILQFLASAQLEGKHWTFAFQSSSTTYLSTIFFQKCQPELVMRSASNTEGFRCASPSLTLAEEAKRFLRQVLLTKLRVQKAPKEPEMAKSYPASPDKRSQSPEPKL